MRTAASALLVILSLLFAAVAGPAIWTERNIVSEQGFVDLAAPLGTNEQFQAGLSSLVATEAAAQLKVPDQLQNLAAAVIKSAAGSLQSQPGYPEAWAQTLRRSHALTFDPSKSVKAHGDVNIDLQPLVALVATKVSGDVGVRLPVPAEVIVSLDQPTVAKVLPWVNRIGGLGGWLAFIAVDLFILAVVLARRRALTMILGAVGMALVALAWTVGSNFAVTFMGGLVTGDTVTSQFSQELAGLAKSSWQWGINAGFVIAAVVAAAGVVSLMVGRSRTP